MKSFGLQINPSRYITDNSLVHWKGMPIPDESVADTEKPENTTVSATPNSSYGTTQAMQDAQALVNNIATDVVISAKDLSYVDNPVTQLPSYEVPILSEKVKYLPISKLSGEKLSVYKQYKDINGGILKDGDQIQITTTILALANDQKITYLDQLQ